MVDVTPVIPPTTPDDIPPSDNRWKIHPLTEQCALNRRISRWKSPLLPDYTSDHVRLATFENWPRVMTPSPASLSAAGFYFTGM